MGVGAGVSLTALATQANQAGLAGLEFFSGVPGRLGGRGLTVGALATTATVFDQAALEVRCLPAQDSHLGTAPVPSSTAHGWLVGHAGAAGRCAARHSDANGQLHRKPRRRPAGEALALVIRMHRAVWRRFAV